MSLCSFVYSMTLFHDYNDYNSEIFTKKRFVSTLLARSLSFGFNRNLSVKNTLAGNAD